MTEPIWKWRLKSIFWGTVSLPIFMMLRAPLVYGHLSQGDVQRAYGMAAEPFQICFPEYFDNND